MILHLPIKFYPNGTTYGVVLVMTSYQFVSPFPL